MIRQMRCLAAATCAMCFAMLTGCSSATEHPMALSLVDLAGESRGFQSKAIDYTELFAVNGALIVPHTRMQVHYPVGARTPGYMIGISNSLQQPTSRITMKSTAKLTETDVLNAKAAIEAASMAANEATLARVESAAVDARQANPLTKLSAGDYATAQAAAATRVGNAEAGLSRAVANARTACNKAGLVVARWNAASRGSSSLSLGQSLGLGATYSREDSGFVILGNVRISMLVFGEDFQTYVVAMDPEQIAGFSMLGVTSYIMYADHVAATSSLNTASAISASLDLAMKDLASGAKFLASLDRIKIAGYYAAVASLENAGMVGPVSWSIEETPICRYEQVDSATIARLGLEPATTNDGTSWCRVINNPLESVADVTGQVVYAVPVTAPRVFKNWHERPGIKVKRVGQQWYALLDLSIRSPKVGGTAGQTGEVRPAK